MKKQLLQCLLMCCCTTSFLSSAAAQNFSEKEQAFIQSTVDKHQLPQDYIEAMLTKAVVDQRVIDAIKTPWEAKPWYQYRPIFITDKRIKQGAEFWRTHQATLAKAERIYGVPAQIIVAILGVETFYGTYKGKYSALNALYTLAFHYPPRSKFFTSELGQLLKLSYEESLDPAELKSSYAGAMGWGQFISSSYRHYSVDFDNDGKRDLFNNPVDAIGSVANYFAEHKWQANKQIVLQASLKAEFTKSQQKTLLSRNLKPNVQLGRLSFFGIEHNSQLASDTKVKVIALENESGNEYYLGLHNFYVITRYNHSPLYAMAVYQLSEAINEAYKTTNDNN